MAKVTNAFDTYSATADREQLSDVIYNISPQATPFMSAIGKNSIKNVVFDWQTENLPTATGAGQLEGFELSRSASTATSRVSNVAQISSRDATVTGSQQASDPAGKKSEMAHQLAIMAKALKRDMEVALCQKLTQNKLVMLQQQELLVVLNLGLHQTYQEELTVLVTGGGAAPANGTQRNLNRSIIKVCITVLLL